MSATVTESTPSDAPSPTAAVPKRITNAQTVCNDAADNEVKRDSLTTAAERTKIYTRCMKGAGYQ